MKLKKMQFTWDKILLLLIISFLFTLTINFFIDFNISHEPYRGRDFYFYLKINFPFVILCVFLNSLFVFYINNTFFKDIIYLKIPIEFLYVFIVNLLHIYLFLIFFYEGEKSFFEGITLMIGNKNIFVNTIEIFLSLLFSELLYYAFKEKNNSEILHKIELENSIYKYNQLKNQINPHFLFNSLNLISAMTYNPENEKGSIYIDKLADIYRYVLQNDEEKIIKLRLEIEFIHKYIDILKIRIYDGLEVDIDLDNDTLSREVLPMSLQLLIENVVKHNIADSETPLHVNIFSDGEYVIVSNNINHKEGYISSMGIGLKNLNQRYKLISGKEIVVINENNFFTVKIPLI